MTRQIEFACYQVNDGGEVADGAIAPGFGLGGLNEAVDAFEDAVIDPGSEPAKDSVLMGPDGLGHVDDGLDAAVCGPEIPSFEVEFGLVGRLGIEILEDQADLVGTGGFQMTASEVEGLEL